VGREGAAAPAGLELQLGRGAWRAAGAGGAKGEMGHGPEGAGLVAVWACCLSKEKALLLRRRLPARWWGRELLGPPG
jgi:hypothetical protein